jgi:hypothetical protein
MTMGETVEQAAFEAEPATAADRREGAREARLATVDAHFDCISALLARAEELAGELLGNMSSRLRSGQAVYPGELIQVCRGLQLLARCGLELRRHLKLDASADTAQPRLTAARIEKLEARLRPLFEQRAA